MPEHYATPPMAPDYSLYREVTATDGSPVTNRKAGLNCGGLSRVNIQVVPSGGANPGVEIFFWSEHAGKFVAPNTAITYSGKGANTPYEFTVDALGRIIFAAVTLSAGKADILAAGAPPS